MPTFFSVNPMPALCTAYLQHSAQLMKQVMPGNIHSVSNIYSTLQGDVPTMYVLKVSYVSPYTPPPAYIIHASIVTHKECFCYRRHAWPKTTEVLLLSEGAAVANITHTHYDSL